MWVEPTLSCSHPDTKLVASFPLDPTMTAQAMVDEARKTAADWKFDVVSIGYPGPVLDGRILSEPHNLGEGWSGFNFEKAFNCPVKVINDAAMQALGSYKGGRMLFLGLGTGLGSAMIIDGAHAAHGVGAPPLSQGHVRRLRRLARHRAVRQEEVEKERI